VCVCVCVCVCVRARTWYFARARTELAKGLWTHACAGMRALARAPAIICRACCIGASTVLRWPAHLEASKKLRLEELPFTPSHFTFNFPSSLIHVCQRRKRPPAEPIQRVCCRLGLGSWPHCCARSPCPLLGLRLLLLPPLLPLLLRLRYSGLGLLLRRRWRLRRLRRLQRHFWRRALCRLGRGAALEEHLRGARRPRNAAAGEGEGEGGVMSGRWWWRSGFAAKKQSETPELAIPAPDYARMHMCMCHTYYGSITPLR